MFIMRVGGFEHSVFLNEKETIINQFHFAGETEHKNVQHDYVKVTTGTQEAL